MRFPARLAILACIGLAANAAIPQPAVLTQDLQQLRAPGKVDAALWTRRPDTCTLQLLFNRKVGAARPGTKTAPSVPAVEAWLVRADGTYIPALSRADLPRRQDGRPCLRCAGREVMFSYPLSALTDAATVSISVDGVYYSQALQAFHD